MNRKFAFALNFLVIFMASCAMQHDTSEQERTNDIVVDRTRKESAIIGRVDSTIDEEDRRRRDY